MLCHHHNVIPMYRTKQSDQSKILPNEQFILTQGKIVMIIANTSPVVYAIITQSLT